MGGVGTHRPGSIVHGAEYTEDEKSMKRRPETHRQGRVVIDTLSGTHRQGHIVREGLSWQPLKLLKENVQKLGLPRT
jgi:hypothetical protein